MSQQTSNSLPVMEFFHTIQGEGQWTGHAAFFIRLSGCDVGCVWCDVKESWEVKDQQYIPIDDLVWEAASYGSELVVITGGEPAMYDLTELCLKLKAIGKRVHIETSGAHEIKGAFDWVCLSPKKFKKPVESSYGLANELKIVVYNASDLSWADQESTKVHGSCSLYLQAEWDRRERSNPLIVDKAKRDPRWKISLQTHKYLNIP